MCGREPGGKNAKVAGVCPAAVDMSFDGINSGTYGGRICWAVAGTFCGGCTQGSFAEKRASCLECDFFEMVQEEEGMANLQTKFLQFITQRSMSVSASTCARRGSPVSIPRPPTISPSP